jgi:hypothetical protein
MFGSKAAFQAFVVIVVFHNKDYRVTNGVVARHATESGRTDFIRTKFTSLMFI